MGSRERLPFDLNELPMEEEDVTDVVVSQPQKSPPVSLYLPSEGSQRILNNHAFSHASSGSGFQPFIRKGSNGDELYKKEESGSTNMLPASVMGAQFNQDSQAVEREEGEWSDADGSSEPQECSTSNKDEAGTNNKDEAVKRECCPAKRPYEEETNAVKSNSVRRDDLNEPADAKNDDSSRSSILDATDLSESLRKNEDISKGSRAADDLDHSSRLKVVKGLDTTNLKSTQAQNAYKKPKVDEQKEAMLGRKRARQTVFINVEDAKQVGPIKASTPRRQSSFPSPIVTRTVKEASRAGPGEKPAERQGYLPFKDQKVSDMIGSDGSILPSSGDQNADLNDSVDPGQQSRLKKLSFGESMPEGGPPSVPRQGFLKPPPDLRQIKSAGPSWKASPAGYSLKDQKTGSKKTVASKKIISSNMQHQDTSIERFIREVTNEKFWHHPEDMELQSVPGQFDSPEEYIRVFEPLLFEECRAQLYSSYEELLESTARDSYVTVRVKGVDRRERGWYDVIVLPLHEYKWTFKEGDVAVLSFPRPGSAIQCGRSRRCNGSNDDNDSGASSGRLVGTVRRHTPIDTREPTGATIHFYLGDSLEHKSSDDESNILRKLQPKSTWYLSSIGTLATTQREYVALHGFPRLTTQMKNAILQPSPDHFPKYEGQPPAMPDCFTPNFVDHIHRTFNGPQLSAIKWAAMHTAAGTSSGSAKRQEPWPFTLVQGPPGTGKTHTVWGMLNVIHLVQYQRYYAALLKKLAPESYKQVGGSSGMENVAAGSIDEVLQSMDQSLFRTLPKLCPKPRMLVCAPSNAATDELLSRVLDRGFIDGEMKVYRPDVARVGVDSQSRAAQAVSVERRTEQLLLKGRDEVIGWLNQLQGREQQLSMQIAHLQRELNVAAAAGRSQGSVGVDPDVLVARDQSRDMLLQNLAAAVESRDKVLVEMSRLVILESKFRPGSNFNLEDARADLEASFANEAEIVFTTVSSSGRRIFTKLSHGFDMVVIDEAAQASEVAVLPPLTLGAARCVLVGDPQQLPATVISKAAGTLQYSRSLFERFQQAGCPTILLSVQYRMHPQIREFPSRYFYQGRLTDSESVANLPDEPYYKDSLMKPYIFYDVHGRESHRGGSASFQNIHEAQFALRLYEHLQNYLKAIVGGKKVSIGIITPYKLQLKCLQREFESVLNTEEGKDIYINTVDAFQGQERDVIIMSCVRASNHGVGFVADIRRMNVALTRARRALWVVGNANALMQSDDWAALIADAKERKCFMDINSLPKEFTAGPSVGSGRASSHHSSNLRTGGQRPRNREMPLDPPFSSRTDVDEKLASFVPKNGSYKNLDDIGNGDRFRDGLPYSLSRSQNSSNVTKRAA